MLVFAWACELVLLDWELTWTRWWVKACVWIRRRLQQVSAYYRSVGAHVLADEFLRLEVRWHFYVCRRWKRYRWSLRLRRRRLIRDTWIE